jgi:hypothetical protein
VHSQNFEIACKQKNSGGGFVAVRSNVVVLFKYFKYFRGWKRKWNQRLITRKVPFYRIKGTHLQDERYPFTGEKVPVSGMDGARLQEKVSVYGTIEK